MHFCCHNFGFEGRALLGKISFITARSYSMNELVQCHLKIGFFLVALPPINNKWQIQNSSPKFLET